MKKRSKRYDFIIYISLILALLCVVISIIDNNAEVQTYEEAKNTNPEKTDLPNESMDTEEELSKTEPEELQNIDKNSIVKKYLDEIMDRVITDETIPYNMIKTWKTYDVINIVYEKEIIEYYYSYRIDLKITGNNISIPGNKNEELSTEDYTVITLRVNILKSGKQNGYVVKAIENPTNM